MSTSQELKKQTISYVIGAFGLVAGLAWNEAIKALIDYLYPLQKDGLPAKFIYAIGITILLVIISTNLSRLIEEKK